MKFLTSYALWLWLVALDEFLMGLPHQSIILYMRVHPTLTLFIPLKEKGQRENWLKQIRGLLYFCYFIQRVRYRPERLFIYNERGNV